MFFIKPKEDTALERQLTWVMSRADQHTLFMENCIPKESDLVEFREYKSRYSFGAKPSWVQLFPMNKDPLQNTLKQDTLSFINHYSGMSRARYFLQGNLFDFLSIFPVEHARNPGLLQTTYASGDLYKDSITKFAQTLKTTFDMYQDNPFLIESFLQIHFQQKRNKSMNQEELVLYNEKRGDVEMTKFTMADLD